MNGTHPLSAGRRFMGTRRLSPGPVLFSLTLSLGCGAGDGAPGREPAPLAIADTALVRMTAELLPAMEARSSLPARAPVRVTHRSRADLEGYLSEELGRQLPPERIAALVRAYARFGLVPADLDLEPLLRSLYLEQVVGYYDPRSDTLFVVEGVEKAQVEAVLAHEIVHALQDQYVDLDSLIQATLADNDRATAARAALEGHATFAMLEWQLSQATGGEVDLTAMSDLSEALTADPLAVVGMEMPMLRDAPAVIRESLLFPYVGGLVFMQKMWRAEIARAAPLGSAMPVSTEQVLHPERFTATGRDDPTTVWFRQLPADGWSEAHVDGLGEFETRVLLREFLDDAVADSAAAGWDGDRYRLLDGPAGEAMVWVTVWDSGADAEEFEAAVREAYAHRYAAGGETEGREVRVTRAAVGGRETVLVVDEPGATAGALPREALEFRLDGGG